MATISQAPATLDLVAVKGDDLTVTLTVTENGTAYNWTGATVATSILDSSGTAVATNFTSATPANGTLTLALTDTQTTTLGVATYRWQVNVTKASATRTWLAGALSVMQPGWGGTSTSSASLSITTGAANVAISNVSTVAASISLADVNNYYSATTVETAFAEIPASIGAWVPAATGDSATDTTNLQSTLTSNAGKVVWLPVGTYVVNGGISVPTGTTLRGCGRGSIVKLKDGGNTNVFELTTNNVTIMDIAVDGNRLNQTSNSNCIKTVGAKTRVVGCYVTSANGYNIVGFNGASSMVVEGCQSFDARDEGIEFMGVDGGLIANNIVGNIGKNGILVWANTADGATNTCKNITITGNVVSGSSALSSGFANIRIEDRADKVLVVGNTISGGGTGCFGISIASTTSYDVTNVSVTGNTITGSPGAGIYVGRSVGTILTGNLVSSSSSDGIYAANSTVKALVVSSNIVTSCSLNGIRLFDLSNFVVSNNVCRNNGQAGTSFNTNGIVLWNSAATPDQGIIANNRCYDDQGVKTQQYGIRTLNTIGSSITITNNIVNGNGTDGLTFSFGGATTASATPWKRLINQSVASTGTTIAHGLPYTPTAIVVSMTSAGNVYRSATSDATNIYLSSDSGTRTCDIYVG